MSGSPYDAAVPGMLTAEEVAARLAPRQAPGVASPGPMTVRATLPPAPPAPEPVVEPEPEPVDDRSLEELEAARDQALATRERLRDRGADLAGQLEALERAIAEGDASLTPGASLDARRERERLRVEIDENRDQAERAAALADRAARAWSAAWSRLRADSLREEIVAKLADAAASDDAIEAAILALVAAEAERAELIAEAERLRAELEKIPAAGRGYVPPLSAAYLDVARLARFRAATAGRRWTFGL